jgi:hypothetical protein
VSTPTLDPIQQGTAAMAAFAVGCAPVGDLDVRGVHHDSCNEGQFDLDEQFMDDLTDCATVRDPDADEDILGASLVDVRVSSGFLRRLRSTNAIAMQNSLLFHAIETLKRVEVMANATQICREVLMERIQQTEVFVLEPLTDALWSGDDVDCPVCYAGQLIGLVCLSRGVLEHGFLRQEESIQAACTLAGEYISGWKKESDCPSEVLLLLSRSIMDGIALNWDLVTNEDLHPGWEHLLTVDDKGSIENLDEAAEMAIRMLVERVESNAMDLFEGTMDEIGATGTDLMGSIVLSPKASPCYLSLLTRDFPQRLAVPSAFGYDDVLMGGRGRSESPSAWIEALADRSDLADLELNDGALTVKGRPDLHLSLMDIRTKEYVAGEDLDVLPLLALYSVTFFAQAHGLLQNDILHLKRAQFARYMGVMDRGTHGNALLDKLQQFEGLLGVFEDGSIYRLPSILSYDTGSDVLSIHCGFFRKLMGSISETHVVSRVQHGVVTSIALPGHNLLWPSSIAAERNKDAVLLAMQITNLIHQAGSKGVPHIRYINLIDRVPNLRQRLKSIDKANDRNRVLKRVFSKAFELIRTRSTAYDRWRDLVIDERIPTTKGLNAVLRIRHAGLNPNYTTERGS